MPPKVKRYVEFDVFKVLFGELLKELPSGRLSTVILPAVVNPEVLQYAKQHDNIVHKAFSALLKFKKPTTANLAELLANETHTELANVLDGPSVVSVMLAIYLCRYCEDMVVAREYFQKLSEEMQLRVMGDTDTYAMVKDEPTPLHLALFRCLKEDTFERVGDLSVTVPVAALHLPGRRRRCEQRAPRLATRLGNER